MHNFNGHDANFYITTGNCSFNQGAQADADYFCGSFYGPNFISTSYQIGTYTQSGNMGWQMHKGTGCTSAGEYIDGTNCQWFFVNGQLSNGKCKIWERDDLQDDPQGLYNIGCRNSKLNAKLSNINIKDK